VKYGVVYILQYYVGRIQHTTVETRACERSVSGEKAASRSYTYFCNNPRSALRSRSATSRSALRSAPWFFCNSRSPLRSAPPDFQLALLPIPLRSRSAHMLW